MSILERIRGHEDLTRLSRAEQAQLCDELRRFLVSHVAETGGHLASNLGVVELSVALETVFDTRVDRLVFDVGHQSYIHKILTDRRDQFSSLRRFGGIAGFPKPSESVTDAFVAGHASNSVSVALGMARARTLQHEKYSVLALIGDGATTGGLAYEGLNDAGASHEPLIVILNDNEMSIAHNVGGMAHHLSTLRTRPGYFGIKRIYRTVTHKIPGGKTIYQLTHRLKNWMKNRLLDTTLFEDMGFTYIGPVDGHDLERMIYLLRVAKSLNCPVVFHVITKKGSGYAPAEERPDQFHGIGPFDPETGAPRSVSAVSFSDTFGDTMLQLGRREGRLCAITAAMPAGTGLTAFERAYDMILQDVAMLHLHVIFAVDRAGLVGEDGETHHGVFDVGFLRQVPGLTILCPGCRAELREMLIWAVQKCDGPVAIRYPRGGDGAFLTAGRETLFRVGRDITLVTYGTMINQVIPAADRLAAQGIEAEVLRLRTIKPLDMEAVATSVRKTGRLLVVEEAQGVGSVGHELIEKLSQRGIPVIYGGQNIGDRFVTHGSLPELYHALSLDTDSIVRRAEEVVRREK